MTHGPTASNPIHPVILCGGLGTRLWPLSRRASPKPFVRPTGDQSLLQATVARVAQGERFTAPLAICHRDHHSVVAEQLSAAGWPPQTIVLEPVGRGTAPAIAAAALVLARQGEEALMLVLPSDHRIGRTEDFLAAVDRAVPAAADGRLVTFGLVPESPESGFGYIRPGAPLAKAPGCFRIAAFVEKPEPDAAAAMVGDGWLWNSGMFLLCAGAYLEALARFQPEVLAACRRAVDEGVEDGDAFGLEPTSFAAAPPVSIDRGVMEHADNAVVVPAEMAWRDVGTWQGLWQAETKDADGNVLRGDVLAEQVTNSYVRADHGLVAALGVDDLVIVADQDAVLVADKARAGDLTKLVERLGAAEGPDSETRGTDERPWGRDRLLRSGPGFQVREITLRPGGRRPVKQPVRAAHWVVVEGVANVTLGEDSLVLQAEQSLTVPGQVDRCLANPGPTPLRIVEVQVGEDPGQDG
jgi:mannose-1-phosphate guanylyltransferase/mannose-6-phosphate isomerase